MKRNAQLESLAHSVEVFPVQNAFPTSLNLTSPTFKVALPVSSPTTSTAPPTFSHMHRALQHSAVMTTIYSKQSNPAIYNKNENQQRYITSNDEQFGNLLKKESSASRGLQYQRRFNKRKSPYQQFSDAKYNNGVYFNPVMNGL